LKSNAAVTLSINRQLVVYADEKLTAFLELEAGARSGRSAFEPPGRYTQRHKGQRHQ
jgi:hypothetical protein